MGNFTSRLCQTPVPKLSFKDMCQRMNCFVVCCDSQCTSITAMPLTKKNNKTVNKKNHRKKIYHLLEKLYYERDRPSALGDVEQFYRAARHYGLNMVSVILSRTTRQKTKS